MPRVSETRGRACERRRFARGLRRVRRRTFRGGVAAHAHGEHAAAPATGSSRIALGLSERYNPKERGTFGLGRHGVGAAEPMFGVWHIFIFGGAVLKGQGGGEFVGWRHVFELLGR